MNTIDNKEAYPFLKIFKKELPNVFEGIHVSEKEYIYVGANSLTITCCHANSQKKYMAKIKYNDTKLSQVNSLEQEQKLLELLHYEEFSPNVYGACKEFKAHGQKYPFFLQEKREGIPLLRLFPLKDSLAPGSPQHYKTFFDIFTQIVYAGYILDQKYQLVHNDFHRMNILIDTQRKMSLIDYELSLYQFDQKHIQAINDDNFIIGDLPSLPPEYFITEKKKLYSSGKDSYSIAVHMKRFLGNEEENKLYHPYVFTKYGFRVDKKDGAILNFSRKYIGKKSLYNTTEEIIAESKIGELKKEDIYELGELIDDASHCDDRRRLSAAEFYRGFMKIGLHYYLSIGEDKKCQEIVKYASIMDQKNLDISIETLERFNKGLKNTVKK